MMDLCLYPIFLELYLLSHELMPSTMVGRKVLILQNILLIKSLSVILMERCELSRFPGYTAELKRVLGEVL